MIFQEERTDIMSISRDVSNGDIQIYMDFRLASLADPYHNNDTESFFLESEWDEALQSGKHPYNTRSTCFDVPDQQVFADISGWLSAWG